MSQPSDKINAKLLLMIAVPLLVGFFLLMFFLNKEEPSKVEKKEGVSIPVPELSQDSVSKSKVDLYMERRRKERQQNQESQKSVTANDFYSLEVKEKQEDVPVQTTTAPVVSEQPAPRPKRDPSPKRESPKPPVPEERPAPSEPVKEKQFTPSFGVVRGSNSAAPSQVADKQAPSSTSGYFSVLLEETITIKNNTNVVFVLTHDIWIDQSKILKNSYFFGKAKEKGNVFDVEIYEIKNADGTILDMRGKNLFLFDEKYSRGLAHEGNLNEAGKDAARETTGETVSGVPTPGTVAAQTALNLLEKGVRGATRKRENTVSLQKGYRLFIKIDKP